MEPTKYTTADFQADGQKFLDESMSRSKLNEHTQNVMEKMSDPEYEDGSMIMMNEIAKGLDPNTSASDEVRANAFNSLAKIQEILPENTNVDRQHKDDTRELLVAFAAGVKDNFPDSRYAASAARGYLQKNGM